MGSNPPKSQSQPKRILLQKETLQTFDKTWLPARLTPPREAAFPSYGLYLHAYEQYLHALQHMKGMHMRLTRRDPALAPAVSVSRKALKYYVHMADDRSQNRFTFMSSGEISVERGSSNAIQSNSLSFSSALQERSVVALPSLAGSVSSWADEVDDNASVQTETPPKPKDKRAHKAGLRKAYRKRRALRKLEARLQKAQLTAEVKKAERKATPRKREGQKKPVAKPEKEAAVKKRLSPSKTRRLEKRRLAREGTAT